uniref:Uncharacterized protein n=1 Tax=Caenorhabditis japonica TaxID=281687 RepID=A0A8R1IAT1_CAEJA
MRRKRQSEAPEESAIRKKKDRESRRLRSAVSTQKEKMMKRISKSQSKLETRLSETKERAEERRSSLQSIAKAKRASETKEQSTERITYYSTRYRKKRMRRMQQRPKTHLEVLFSVRSAANALPSHSDGRGRVCDERVQKIKRAVADVLL